MKTLNLVEISIYQVVAPASEYTSSVVGRYKSLSNANDNTKSVGWYGSNGTVSTVTLYTDTDGLLYDVKCLGLPTDVKQVVDNTLLDSIKSKLTEEEIEFIINNSLQ